MSHHHKVDRKVNCFVVTISDTRDQSTDKSGDLIVEFLEDEGHKVIERKIVPDEAEQIREVVKEGSVHSEVDVLLMSGGTGIARRDVTIETIEPMFDKHITGFGELFRMLSYTEDIGARAIMSRATAGVVNNTAVFSMPGSSGAVKLAMEKLIIPELQHVVFELNK